MRSAIFAIALGLLAGLSVAHAEPVQFRGVIEGYYGRPWGTAGRLSVLKFMGEHDMNTFIYGPKDDPYHHSKWREPYPRAELADFKKLLECAKLNKVNFYWAIHLGGTFNNNPKDYASLFQKLNWMHDAGFRSFAVFFDDFGGSDAKFHAEICNRVQREFIDAKGDCAPLIMCPRAYSGNGNPYQRTLGAALDKRVQIMWTGRGVCDDIRAGDVAQITKAFQRPPFIWWNWPVNDYCRSRILLGRTYGLDKCKIAGFVTNPMENCEANKIAIYSVAKWCLDPDGFNSVKCWEESFQKLYPHPKVAKAMHIFAEHNSDQGPTVHRYRREESVRAAPLCAKARKEFRENGALTPGTAAELKKLFTEVGEAATTLLRELPKDKGLGWELQGWLEHEKLLMTEGLRTLALLQSPNDKKKRAENIAKIIKARAAMRKSAEAHKAKFAAATFANDSKRQKDPLSSTRELLPLVEELLTGTLRACYKKKTGKDFSGATGFKCATNVKTLKGLTVSRDGKAAGISRVMEPHKVGPGEMIVLSVPSNWQTTYFHAKLGGGEVSASGVIEVSKDGHKWTKLATRNNGGEMQLELKKEDGWRHARYHNVSKKPVPVKLEQFKFDVIGEASVIDELLKALR